MSNADTPHACFRILVVDDFEPWRRQICSMLQTQPDLHVIAEIADGLEAVQRAQELKPDLTLLDIGLPNLNGIEVANRIRQVDPSAKIIFLTQQSDEASVQAALSTGAQGYVLKTDAGSELFTAMAGVLGGDDFVSSGIKRGDSGETEDNQPSRRFVMRRKPEFIVFLAFVFLTAVLHADCVKEQDHRSGKNSGLLITDFVISGTQSLSSDELTRIESKLIGSCFNEDSEELEERVRALFQNQGYFASTVKSLHIKTSDPLALPKPATLEAEVLEGPRHKVGEINFSGNQAFSSAELRGAFPVNRGDLFNRDKIATGIEGVRDLYVRDGFIDVVAIPDTHFSNATADLALSVIEGQQYRMGKLNIIAKKEVSERLQAEWQLSEGVVFDAGYVDKYISPNRSLLPVEFTREDVQVVRDCPDASVEIRVLIDATNPLSRIKPKDVECETPKEDTPTARSSPNE